MTELNKKRRTMRHYDHSAKVYDALYSQEQDAKIRAALNNLLLRKCCLVLDAGCGTGLLFPYIAETAKLIVGIDISTGILREAKKKINQYSNISLLRADADYAPFTDHIFDAIFAITVLQNVPNQRQTLFEMKRVGKNGALMVATGLKKILSRDEFSKLLRQAGLKVLVIKENGLQKEHIALCTLH